MNVRRWTIGRYKRKRERKKKGRLSAETEEETRASHVEGEERKGRG